MSSQISGQKKTNAEKIFLSRIISKKALDFPISFASDLGLNAARKGGEGEQSEHRRERKGTGGVSIPRKISSCLIRQTKQKLNKGSRRVRAKEKFHSLNRRPRSLLGSRRPPDLQPRGSPSLSAPALQGINREAGRPGQPHLVSLLPPLSGSLSDLAAGSGTLPAKLHLLKGPAPAVSNSSSSAKVYQGKES